MATQKKKGPRGEKAEWVRTAGATGDECMARMEKWNQDGAGVEDDEYGVGDMPNERVMRPMEKGRIR